MFAAPLFLLGLAAAGIPLLLHLRRARHERPMVFSTTRFFDEAFIRAARRARLQDRLLMLLRMALLVLFALALAQPLLRLPGLGALSGGGRRVAIVLDDSASMGIVSQRGVLLDRARQAALVVLDELSASRGDRATVVLAGQRDGSPAVLFEEPTSDLESVREAVRQVALTDLATDLEAAITAAVKSLGGAAGGASGLREICVVSDLQESAFAPGASDAPSNWGRNLNLLFIAIRPSRAIAGDNVSVDVAQYGALRPMLGVPYTFRALVTNHSNQQRRRTFTLVINGDPVAHRQVELGPNRSHVARFVHRFTRPGWFAGRIEVDQTQPQSTDSQPADDARHFTMRVEQSVRLLAINGAPSQISANDELFFFRTALHAAQHAPETTGPSPADRERVVRRIEMDEVTPAKFTGSALARYPLVVMANVASLTPTQIEALEHYVDAGGNLLVTLGDHVDADRHNQWVGDHRLHGGLLPAKLVGLIRVPGPGAGAVEPDEAETDFIASIDADHPTMAPFADAQLGYLTSVHFRARYALDAGSGAARAVLMSTPSGQPLLVEKRFGQGRVMLFASSIDRDWTNFPLQTAYVPWVYRLISYLAQPGMKRSGFVRTGQIVRLPTSTTRNRLVRVQRPDGGFVYPEPAADGADSQSMDVVDSSTLTVAATELAGVYSVRPVDAEDDDPPDLLFAANAPSREWRSDYMDEAALESKLGADIAMAFVDGDESIEQAVQVARRGYGLWDQLLMLALIVALVEPWVANLLTRRRGEHVSDALGRRSLVTGSQEADKAREVA